MRLRFRLFIMIAPLVVVVVVLSGVFSSLQSRKSLTQVANRHLAYKAEQLRDYFYSEWQVITELGLDSQVEYRSAAERSFQSFAFSLLRSTTEVIYVFDSDDKVVMRIGLQQEPREEHREPRTLSEGLSPGWFSREIFGESRVGVVFEIVPYNWTVAVTELDEAFFSDMTNISLSHALILAGAVAGLILFLSLFVGHIVRPVERLTNAVKEIRSTGDLSKRAEVEFADEIGYLANNFNAMIGSLRENYAQLEQSHKAEAEARYIAVEHEQETLLLLSRVSDVRDEETGSHLKRIGILSAQLCKLLGQSEERQQLMLYSAPLHDIGKIGIPESILLKKGKLTPEEYETMKKHTLYGYELLKDTHSVYLNEGAKIALTHHEKWDGSGYPAGLKGEEIPIEGRIVGLVDVFDALVSERPYKKAWSREDALEYVVAQNGKHFDPELVELFLKNFEIFNSLSVRK